MACRAYDELSPEPQLDQKYTGPALDHCQALLEYLPDTEFADRAGDIIERMPGKLAANLYQTGEWYFGRGAYDSALIIPDPA